MWPGGLSGKGGVSHDSGVGLEVGISDLIYLVCGGGRGGGWGSSNDPHGPQSGRGKRNPLSSFVPTPAPSTAPPPPPPPAVPVSLRFNQAWHRE